MSTKTLDYGQVKLTFNECGSELDAESQAALRNADTGMLLFIHANAYNDMKLVKPGRTRLERDRAEQERHYPNRAYAEAANELTRRINEPTV